MKNICNMRMQGEKNEAKMWKVNWVWILWRYTRLGLKQNQIFIWCNARTQTHRGKNRRKKQVIINKNTENSSSNPSDRSKMEKNVT